ncbi:MAG: nucleotidyltransferase domain-containing protein [Chloroflexota bacterium]|nr:nucleotidyltransferase domain-containing protein [Chloroflexota bacterium]
MEPTITAAQSTTEVLPDVISEEFLALLRARGVTQAFLFGSVASRNDRPQSDLDLLVTFDQPVTLFKQLDLAEELTRLCGRKVDLMTRIDPAFAPYILPTLVILPL